jgi:hypothetical protein
VSDFTVFSGLSSKVEAEYKLGGPDPWENSPFQWISEAPSARKGAVGRKLVRRWAEREGLQVADKSGRGHAFRVGKLRVAVKLSLVWADGRFVFEQIQKEGYDVAALLALEPQGARLWIVPCGVLWQQIGFHHGRADKWLHFPATKPPAWLTKNYGRGTLPRAKKALK